MPRKADPLTRLRKLCLALPETTEKVAWNRPTFRVRDKMFGLFADNFHHDGRVALWCSSPRDVRDILVEFDPDRFFVPPYFGPRGWLGVYLDGKLDWDELHEVIKDGYRQVAPKRLSALVDA